MKLPRAIWLLIALAAVAMVALVYVTATSPGL